MSAIPPFLPESTQEPIEVTQMSESELHKIFASRMNNACQELIIRALLIAANKGGSKEEVEKLMLAARLFLKMHANDQQGFVYQIRQNEPQLRQVVMVLESYRVFLKTKIRAELEAESVSSLKISTPEEVKLKRHRDFVKFYETDS